MSLDQSDIHAIAVELHRLLRGMDSVQMDVAHRFRTVPLEERMRQAREKMREKQREAKRAAKETSRSK